MNNLKDDILKLKINILEVCKLFENKQNTQAYESLQGLITELNSFISIHNDLIMDDLVNILRDALIAMEQGNIDELVDVLKYGLVDVLDDIN